MSPMRMERHVRADGLVVVNDAYNANPESMEAALRSVAAIGHGRAVAVLGAMLELGDQSHDAHVRIGRLAAELGYLRVVVVGAGADGIAEGAGDIAEPAADVDVATRTLSASLMRGRGRTCESIERRPPGASRPGTASRLTAHSTQHAPTP